MAFINNNVNLIALKPMEETSKVKKPTRSNAYANALSTRAIPRNQQEYIQAFEVYEEEWFGPKLRKGGWHGNKKGRNQKSRQQF